MASLSQVSDVIKGPEMSFVITFDNWDEATVDCPNKHFFAHAQM